METTPLAGLRFPTGVALAQGAWAYGLDESGIWRVQDGTTDLVVGDRDATVPSQVTEPASIEAVAIDDQGRLLWTATVPDPKNPSNPALIVVRRLDGTEVSLVAGSTTHPAAADAVYQAQEDPPADAQAVGFPMLVPGPGL